MKDDPLDQAHHSPVTLWLDSNTMKIARENFRQAYNRLNEDNPALEAEWELAWAAAIAAYSYLMEGRIEPR